MKATRISTSADIPFVDRNPLLREPESANDVPGRDSTHFVVRKVSGHKPGIFQEDRRTGSSELLLARASAPRPSPDGKLLACTVWRSIQRPWTLVILDLKTRHVTEPALDGCASPYAWSPDGRVIAVMVTPCQAPKSRLALVDVPTGTLRWIDSLAVAADYEFGWSPDSRRLAVVRPTAVDEESEDPIATELWIISDRGRERCRVAVSPGYIMSSPKWITNTTLQIDRTRRGVGRGRVVLDLSEGKQP